MAGPRPLKRLLLPLGVGTLLWAGAGCVERKLTIDTVPEGAEILVDGHAVGKSPVTLPFSFYGAREIVCRKPGYEPHRTVERLEPPYFQQFPWDVYYEVFTRRRYEDHRTFRYVLRPLGEEDLSRGVVERALRAAKELRER